MSAPVLESSAVEVQVLVRPVNAGANYGRACALTECYAGWLEAGGAGGAGAGGGKHRDQKPVAAQLLPAGDEDESDADAARSFGALEWQGQPFLKAAGGPLEWARLGSDGSFERGVTSALQSQPDTELCGWTLRPRLRRLHSAIVGAVSALEPQVPADEPVLEWTPTQNTTWERVVPAKATLWGGVRHRTATPNAALKIRTTPQPENVALCVVFDLGGAFYGHEGEPAIRFEWGGAWSFVLRGQSADARPGLEKRTRVGGKPAWELWRRLDGAPPLDESFWRSRHVLRLYRLAGRLVLEWDGQAWWMGEDGGEVSWPRAPLQFSPWGADCILQVGQLDFERLAWFRREAPVAVAPSDGAAPFTLRGNGAQSFEAGNASAPGRGRLHGANLENVYVAGIWSAGSNGGGLVSYGAQLYGERFEAPLLCGLGLHLPATTVGTPPEPLDVRAALVALHLSSGEPGALPSAEARVELAPILLERLCPGWQTTLVPFRPLEIRAREMPSAAWHTLFRGYLLPGAAQSREYNDERLLFVARDEMLRLQAPTALVDDRFAPLDLLVGAGSGPLYGAQGVQHLLEVELGSNAAEAFNGNGDPFRFLPPGHYPLLDAGGRAAFARPHAPRAGSFHLPPPFGEDLKTWLDRIAAYDGATWFYDSGAGGFVYGTLRPLLIARGATVWQLRGATTEGPQQGDAPGVWPLVSEFARAGWGDGPYTGAQFWSAAPTREERAPALAVGRFEPPATVPTLDPLSSGQSWRRTLLVKQPFTGAKVGQEYADASAWRLWQEFGGRAPRRFDFTLGDGSALRARWGELAQWQGENLRVVRVEHQFSFEADCQRLVTRLTARSLSAVGL